MRNLLLILSVLALTLVSTVASAEGEDDGPLRLDPCEGDSILTLDGDAIDLTMPLIIEGDSASQTYKLDLSGQEVADDEDMDDKATVTAIMTWDLFVNDYDLDLGGTVSENYQPLDPAQEVASRTYTHCQTVLVSAVNFLGTGGDSVSIALDVRL